MEEIIEIQHAVKTFGKITVLQDVSLTVRKGTICGIVGRNGSGKTVLFKAVCGFYRLTSGVITVKGKRLGKDTDIPENVGSIIETPGFLGHFSGYHNLKYLAGIRGRIGKAEIFQAIEQVGLDPRSRKHVSKYSLGMRQRLGLAQAFMNGLDNQGVSDMRNMLLDLKEQGKTILMASHNKEDIETLCDEVYEMNGGILTRRTDL